MTNSSIKIIGENIKKYRKLKKLSQEKLSELVGLSTDYISLLELGKRVPSIKRLYKIADALGVEPYRFLKENKD